MTADITDMINFFRRVFGPEKPKMPPINEDWRVGDWATPINRGKLRLGSKWLVTRVSAGYNFHTKEPAWVLILAGSTPRLGCDGWLANDFRKITSDTFEEPRRTEVRIPEKIS